MNRAPRTLRLSIVIILVVLSARLGTDAATTAVAAPQAQLGVTSMPGTPVVLRALPTNSFTTVAPPAGFGAGLSVQTATINVTYIGFSPEAQTGFQFAVDIWETLITSSVPINVTATWEQLGPGILGSAGATFVVRDFPNAPVANTWYPVALGNKLAGSDLVPAGGDISASFNSDFGPNWYLGTDGNTPAGKYDFVSVVLHEIGHGLGFFGSMFVSGGSGSWGCGSGFPCIYDRFAENGAGQSLINTALFPNPSAALATQLTSNNIFFDGPNANAANGGLRPKLYAPNPFQGGSSFSHLDETTYPAGNANSLMTPAIGSAESIHNPGPITLGIFQDMGWSGGGPPPASFTLTVSKNGSGTVTSTSPPSPVINCGATCSANYDNGTVVTLIATPAAGWQFTGWSGACTGTGLCNVTMNANKTVTATFSCGRECPPPPPSSFTLTVNKTGTGSGTVTSTSPPSPIINCGATCTASYPSGTVVTLAAAAGAGSVFAGWSGACSGTGGCSVTMDAAKSVTATFNLSSPPTSFTLTVNKTGTGSGTVTSTSPPSPVINCGGTCSANFPSGTVVTLVATAAAGSTFAGWSGACAGTGTCNVTMDAAKTVTATFNLSSPPSSFTLTVTKVGQGTVTSTSPPSPTINCGATCSASYPSGTMVTLTASPGASYIFVGWGGACTGFGTCTVTIDAAKGVTAIFVQGRS